MTSRCDLDYGTVENSFLLYKNVTRQYNDPKVLRTIRELIPDNALQDGSLESLLKWFKDFMKWIPNQPVCSICMGKNNNSEEKIFMKSTIQTGNSWKVRKIEVHTCSKCGNQEFYPRYNDVLKIAETRMGRCGEWSILFGAVLSSMSLQGRIAHDYLDHCWNEVNLDGRWIHVDSSLQYPDSFNHPYYYERNWKKKYLYVLAFSTDTVEDVTRRYTEQWNDVLDRREQLQKNEKIILSIPELKSFYSGITPACD